jgi:nucleotide-binding universal stress UspA family protein
MAFDGDEMSVTSTCKTGTILFVADFVTGSRDVLDFACELADSQNADLQLLHVIDPEHTHSGPGVRMGSQYSLEMLAQSARALKRSTVSLLSFGCPESVIPRRAAEVNASLVVLPLDGSAADRLQKRLVRRLRAKCDCPVLALPSNLFIADEARSFSVRSLLSLVRQVCEGDLQWVGELMRSSKGVQSRPPLTILPKTEYILRR